MHTFRQAGERIAPQLTEIFRELHRHPELGFQEKRTTAYIAEHMRRLGLEVTVWDDVTGLVALLRGGKPGPCVALRADIDALPMPENNSLPYCSRNPGRMHACGHDAHATALIGAAMLLAARREEVAGTVKFIFQPAEELLQGAQALLKKGVLREPEPSFIFGLHCMPGTPTGTVRLAAGPVMAAGGPISLRVKGVGGHGSSPHLAVDPVLAAAGMILALQSIASREISPLETVVVSFGSIHGGSAGNVIPESVELTGTVRSFSQEVMDGLEERMRRIIESTAQAYRTTSEFAFGPVTPVIVNPPDLVEWLAAPLAAIVGGENVASLKPMMGSEDFAYYMAETPGVFAFFGTGSGESAKAPWHHPDFAVDERALPLAAAVYAGVAQAWLTR